MTKKAWGVLIGIIGFLAMAGTLTGGISYWYSYYTTEIIHETVQDEDIELAMNQSTLALSQQRMKWLEMRIYEVEKQYGCPNCTGSIKKIYNEYVLEYKALQDKVNALMRK